MTRKSLVFSRRDQYSHKYSLVGDGFPALFSSTPCSAVEGRNDVSHHSMVSILPCFLRALFSRRIEFDVLYLAYRKFCIACALVSALFFLAACSGAQTYVVREGDSLPDIALRYDVALSDLIHANQDRYPALAVDPENPQVGIELVIPSEGDLGIDKWFARLAAVLSPPITPAPDVPAAPNEKISAISQLIQHGINHERAAHQLSALIFDARLGEIAQTRSNDMIRRAYFSHQDPQLGSIAFRDLIRGKQYRFIFAGENIAEIINQGSRVRTSETVYSRYGASEIADQFVNGWLHSQEHLDNILNPHFTKTGIALGVSVDGTRIVATQIFTD